MKFAIIENGAISNIAESDSPLANNWVDYQEGYTIGDLYDGSTFSKASVDLAEVKARVWEEIKKYRDNLVENGGCKMGGHWYHSDTISRTRYLGLMMLGASIPAGKEWKTMENGFVPITQTWVQQVFGALFAQDAALMDAGKAHKTALDASSDPANYDYTTGWPETYTGA